MDVPAVVVTMQAEMLAMMSQNLSCSRVMHCLWLV